MYTAAQVLNTQRSGEWCFWATSSSRSTSRSVLYTEVILFKCKWILFNTYRYFFLTLPLLFILFDAMIIQINKLHLCKPLIRAIDSSNLKNDYSQAQKVTYKYYVGRKAMFDSDFKLGKWQIVVIVKINKIIVFILTGLVSLQLRNSCPTLSITAIGPARRTRGWFLSTCCQSKCFL